MKVMEAIGYIASIFIGISLGLIGGGGSVLTVPVLVYLFDITPEMSTAYSLFIVGITALVGAIRNASLGQIEYKTALVFAVPAFIAVYLTRRFLVPSIPDPVFSTELMTLSKDTTIMVFFALIMLAAAVSMIRSLKDEIELAQKPV
ncbi:MAG TPA: permease, partial [Cryomorphaceae bacterium]|nr:permease [Cryomorphaceae bacterium]